MRLKKISELIHNSALYPNLESATVSVFFQEIEDNMDSEDDYTVIPE